MMRSDTKQGFFHRLSPDLQAKLQDASVRQLFADKQCLQERGERTLFFSIIEKGHVRFGTTGRNGSFVSVSRLGPGDIFGDIAIFGARVRVHDAFAQGDVAISRIPESRFLGFLEQEPELALSLLKLMGKRLTQALDALDDALRQPLVVRLGRFLLRTYQNEGVSGRIDIGQSDLAEAMASSRVSISKALRDLSDLGFVETGYGYVRIRNPDALRQWIDCAEMIDPLDN